ncbi:thiol-specific monooxygenase [Diplodia corticola]|uniref:Thiol-specific monooxygenase n=1 Tax=Diplodia corticola TaxID=236234 RepID=A0A1J9QQS3_9PEZI|nr:thiol-specific monooxygenase [Diplodia corticola]OJD30793.1 thiol-specific monooxygenase [Diplodia corticola]
MSGKAKRVAVVGAGPAGAISVDALVKEQAFSVIRVFERKPVAGGTWVFNPDLEPRIPSLRDVVEGKADAPVPIPSQFPAETPRSEAVNGHDSRFTHTAVWDHLHSNIPPSVMDYTQEPFPNIVSEQSLSRFGPDAPFRHRSVIRDWVENIFVQAGHTKLVEFSTTVELAEQRGDEWILTLRKEIPGKDKDVWWQETFDALVVASGHYYVPFIPNIPGLIEYDQRFPGRIHHSKHYRSPEPFRNKRVVVVGGAISAIDILQDIKDAAQQPVYASLRQPVPSLGWVPFQHPHIATKKEITRFDPDSGAIHFADGTSLPSVDAVVFATGYAFTLPFLPHVDIVQRRRIPGLYLHVFRIDADPTTTATATQPAPPLVFIGAVAGGFTFRAFEWQAVAAARVLAGRAALPGADAMRRWERARLEERGEGRPFYTLAPDWEGYFEALREVAGEPAEGTTGRVLPRFDGRWVKTFEEVLEVRLGWWRGEAERARQRQRQREREAREGAKARL